MSAVAESVNARRTQRAAAAGRAAGGLAGAGPPAPATDRGAADELRELPRRAKKVVVLGGNAWSLLAFRGDLLRAMAGQGHSVTACAPSAPASLVHALAADGIAYRPVPIDRGGLRPERDLSTLVHLTRLLRELRPDTLLSYMMKPVIYGSLAARLAAVPEHFSMITGLGMAFGGEQRRSRWLRPMIGRMCRLSVGHSRRIFFQNPDDLRAFERLGIVRDVEQPVMINGSGVDLEAFRPAPLPATISFLLIARLFREKGIREYVEAARLIRARYPQVRFRLVGWIDRHAGAILEDELAGWQREGVIEFLGRLEDVRDAIAASSIYVLPSYYREGTPRTVLEAMAMGRPVVTTDAPGCREPVRHGVNGYLVPPRDVRALAQALQRFIDQPQLMATMGRQSRRLAEERYDVRKVNAVILQTMGLA